MIIQVRGTSGSGKSTVMRRVMAQYDWESILVPRRLRPLYYRNTELSCCVLGHYDSPCGGCDTIGSARAVYDVIQELPETDVVLCEGLLLSEDVKWSVQMVDLRVIFLTTSIEQCLLNVAARRHDTGNLKPLNPKNTTQRCATIERARQKLSAAGVTCYRCSANQTPGIILKWLRLHAQPEVNNGPGTELDSN